MTRLTPYQHLILLAASNIDALPRFDVIPNGVYRSLVIRGLLSPHSEGYAITAEGNHALARLQTMKDSERYQAKLERRREQRALERVGLV